MRRSLLPVVVVGVLLIGCSDGGSASIEGGASTETAPNSTLAPDAAAPEVLQFSAQLVSGGDIDFTQYAGRTVALWFWAPT